MTRTPGLRLEAVIVASAEADLAEIRAAVVIQERQAEGNPLHLEVSEEEEGHLEGQVGEIRTQTALQRRHLEHLLDWKVSAGDWHRSTPSS